MPLNDKVSISYLFLRSNPYLNLLTHDAVHDTLTMEMNLYIIIMTLIIIIN